MSDHDKILLLDDLGPAVAAARADGRRVVLSCGVFDLLHVGHIRHLEAAKQQGDVLVVVLTPDRFVNQGPHRPAFAEQMRAEAVAALGSTDYVAVGRWPTAHEVIRCLEPTVYACGRGDDNLGSEDALEQLKLTLETTKTTLFTSDEATFSTGSLINRHLDVLTPQAKAFLSRFRSEHTPEGILDFLHALKHRRVLVIGEAIIDEYQFCDVMGKASKEPILAARHNYTERYAGGVMAIANHVASFCGNVALATVLGGTTSHETFIRESLAGNVAASFIFRPNAPTITKRRYLDEYLSTKLFEVYEIGTQSIEPAVEDQLCKLLDELLPKYDTVVVADYGHGLMTKRVIDTIVRAAGFLAVNAQTNAGNRGFNMVTKYPRADYVSIDETEARLEVRDELADVRQIVKAMKQRMECRRFMVTRGNKGCLLYDDDTGFTEVPAFAAKIVDRIGAGDAVLAITSPLVASGVEPEVVGFLGNVAGAEACATIGNKRAIDQRGMSRHVASLMK